MKLRFFLNALLLVVAVFLLSACAGKKKGEISIISVRTFKPYVFSRGNDIVGVDVDICKEVAKKLNKETKIKTGSLNEVFELVTKGDADVGIGGLSVTKERSDKVLFSIPYMKTTQTILVRKDSTIKVVNDLKKKGLRIGCTADSTSEGYLRKNVSEAEIIPYIITELMVNELLSGRIDAIVWDVDPVKTVIENNEGDFVYYEIPGTEEEYAIALPKDRFELCEEFNAVIAEMKESGKLHALIEKNKKLCVRVESGL